MDLIINHVFWEQYKNGRRDFRGNWIPRLEVAERELSCDLSYCHIGHISHYKGRFVHCDFTSARIDYMSGQNGSFYRCDFTNARIRYGNWYGAMMRSCNLTGLDIEEDFIAWFVENECNHFIGKFPFPTEWEDRDEELHERALSDTDLVRFLGNGAFLESKSE